MAAIITDDFRKINIERFFNDVDLNHASGGKDYYIGIGKTDPYENDALGNTDSSDAFSPPTPIGSIIDKEDIKKNLMTLKLVKPADVKRMIPQVPFKIGSTYKVYNPFDPTCFDITEDFQPCYALYTGADGRARIYACLGNNDNAPTSEVISDVPSGNAPFGAVQNSTDKYIWAYVCDWDKHKPDNKFASSRTFMNLPLDKNIDAVVDPAAYTDGRKRAAQASAGLLYGFAVNSNLKGLNYPAGSNGHPRTGADALSATIVGEYLNGDPITSNNTCTVETAADGSISKVNWTLQEAQALGYGVASAPASTSTSGTSSGATWTGMTLSGTSGDGGVKFASLIITDSELTDTGGSATGTGDHAGQGFQKAEILPLFAPQYGFGHSPLTDLPSYYAGISADFEGPIGDKDTAGTNAGDAQYIEEALVDVNIREISLLRDSRDDMVFKDGSGNDIEDDGGSAYPDTTFDTGDALNCLKYFQIADVSGAPTTANDFPGAYIQQTGGTARAWLDQVSRVETLDPLDADPNDASNDPQGGYRIYFHQNSSRKINEQPFTTSGNVDLVKADGSAIAGASNIAYTIIKDGEYRPNSGDVLFVDKKNPITRNTQQTEEVRLIIQF
jgi:hypothetical protein